MNEDRLNQLEQRLQKIIDENEIDHVCNKCGKKAISEDHLTIYGLCGNCNENAVKETQRRTN